MHVHVYVYVQLCLMIYANNVQRQVHVYVQLYMTIYAKMKAPAMHSMKNPFAVSRWIKICKNFDSHRQKRWKEQGTDAVVAELLFPGQRQLALMPPLPNRCDLAFKKKEYPEEWFLIDRKTELRLDPDDNTIFGADSA